MKHNLKTTKPYFEHILSKNKRFEARKDDRGFKVGDEIVLEEYDADKEQRTGRRILIEITYILPGGDFGIMSGYVVFSFRIKAFHV